MGGPELDPVTFYHVIEELSMMDGSVGWCALLSSAGAIYAGSLSVDVGRYLFGQPPDFRGAGSFRPEGEARIVEGGYLVSGRWDYASGIDHANHLFFNCKVLDDNGPRLTEAGNPELLMMFAPIEAATVYDTWSVVGMCATGSNDFVLEDVFVPVEHTFKGFASPQEAGPLYHPRLFLTTAWAQVAANCLGMARGALNAFVELATQSATTISATLLRDRPQVQATVGEAEATISAARTYLLATLATAWRAFCEGAPDPSTEIAQARLAITHGVRESMRAVDLLFAAGGTAAIHRRHPLERFFRDIHVAARHGAGLPANFESGGKVMLGLRPSDPCW
jgi:alkylation response protein AidB-like acyl-CoA dehydrogenase